MNIFSFLKKKKKNNCKYCNGEEVDFGGVLTEAMEKTFSNSGNDARREEFLAACSKAEAKRIEEDSKIEDILFKYKDNQEVLFLIGYFANDYDRLLKWPEFKARLLNKGSNNVAL